MITIFNYENFIQSISLKHNIFSNITNKFFFIFLTKDENNKNFYGNKSDFEHNLIFIFNNETIYASNGFYSNTQKMGILYATNYLNNYNSKIV